MSKITVLRTALAIGLAIAGALFSRPGVAQASANCNTPGVVENRSNKNITVRYDNNLGIFFTATLAPGQNSSSIFCDIDQFTVTSGSFVVTNTTYPSGYYFPGGIGGGSIGWGVWRCGNGGSGSSGVFCTKIT